MPWVSRFIFNGFLAKMVAYLVILTVELPAFDRINSRRPSMRFQYFSHPLHSAYTARYKAGIHNDILCISNLEITHHKRDTGAELDCWATWGRMYNCLCKCEDIRVHLDTVPNLNMYNMMTCNQNVL